jgi:hypothetical protein
MIVLLVASGTLVVEAEGEVFSSWIRLLRSVKFRFRESDKLSNSSSFSSNIDRFLATRQWENG